MSALPRPETHPRAARTPSLASRAGIRLLGRLLGEVIGDQHGPRCFERVEDIRRHAVGDHRDGEADLALAERLQRLDTANVLILIRAFSIFAQLANIADDHLSRRDALHSDGPLQRLEDDARVGARAAAAYAAAALLAPVITAHPTEVRRNMRVCQRMRISRFMSASSRRASEVRRPRRSCACSRSARAASRSWMLLRRTSVGWAVITGASRAAAA